MKKNYMDIALDDYARMLKGMASTVFSSRKNMITVFHGSTSLFEEIDVAKGKPYKDFGRGFYVTHNFNHAKNIALRNQKLEIKRYSKEVGTYLYTYDFDLQTAKTKCRIRDFALADREWFEFILANRKSKGCAHDFDIVLGPTADDDTRDVLNLYSMGVYGEVGSTLAKETAVRLLEVDNLPTQVFFATPLATQFLTRKGEVKIL